MGYFLVYIFNIITYTATYPVSYLAVWIGNIWDFKTDS